MSYLKRKISKSLKISSNQEETFIGDFTLCHCHSRYKRQFFLVYYEMMHHFVRSTYYHTMYIYYKYTLNVFTKLEYGISLDRVYAYIIQGFIFLIWLKANQTF